MLRVESRLGQPLEVFLEDRYQSKTQRQIADELGLDVSTINRWMRELDIEPRFPGQRPPEAVA